MDIGKAPSPVDIKQVRKMCLGAVSATLEKEWKVNVPFCSMSIPTSSRKLRTQDWQKCPG